MNHDFINKCVDLSELHILRFLKRNKEDCGDYESNPFDSLRYFLWEYAFERQGSSRDFAAVANEVILEASEKGKDFSSLKGEKIWNTFTKKLNEVSVKPNPACNPLCPQGTKYRNKGNTKTVGQISVIELMLQEKLSNVGIVSFAKEKLDLDQVEEAHKILNKINGVGPKIASLFLRDVAVRYDYKKISNNKELLQPIDTWIRYCARTCECDKKLTDNECADFLINGTDEPEKANQGIWYFCTQVAKSSRLRVKRSIEDQKYMKQLIKKHKEDLIYHGKAGKSFGG